MFNTTQWLQQLEHNEKPLSLWKEMLNTLANIETNCQCAILVAQDNHYKVLVSNDNHHPLCDWESVETRLTTLFTPLDTLNSAFQSLDLRTPHFQSTFDYTPIQSMAYAPIIWPNGEEFGQLCLMSAAADLPLVANATPHFARLASCDLKQFIAQNSSLFSDDLTQLLNQQGFTTLGTQKVKDAPRYQLAIGIIYIQIDRVDEINAAYGVEVGDQCYVTLSEVLKSACREADIVARINDNEFVVLSLLNTRRQLNQLAHRIENDYKLRVKTTETLNLSALLSKTFITDCFSTLSLAQLVDKAKFCTE